MARVSTTASPAPAPRTVEFGRRLASTVGLWGLVVAVFVWGHPLAFASLVVLLATLGTVEFHLMARQAGLQSAITLSVVACVGYSVALHCVLLSPPHSPAALHLVDSLSFCLLLGLLFVLRLRLPIDGQRAVVGIGVALLGFVYLAFAFNFLSRVVFLGYDGSPGRPPGAWIALWLAAVTKFTDMGAYLVGSAIGRHKMIPHISPAKTWEGLCGAFLLAQLAACGLLAIFPKQLEALGGWDDAVILGFLLAGAAVVGDLAESLLKRSLAIKDSGQALPGIGGVLDLIDSLCFSAPVLYFYLHLRHGVL